MDHGHVADIAILEDEQSGPFDKEGERLFVKANAGMMIVVPAWHLKDMLLSEELIVQRRNLDKTLPPTHVVPD
jgi:hypothetical protein